MTAKNDGGPAFPHCSRCGENQRAAPLLAAIDLRDYFAGMAMQSYLFDKDRDSFTFEQWAQASYEMADAMLEVRGD